MFDQGKLQARRYGRRSDLVHSRQPGSRYQDASAHQQLKCDHLGLAAPGPVDAALPARQGAGRKDPLMAAEAYHPPLTRPGKARTAQVVAPGANFSAAHLIGYGRQAATRGQRVLDRHPMKRATAEYVDHGHCGGPYVVGVATGGHDPGGAFSCAWQATMIPNGKRIMMTRIKIKRLMVNTPFT
jgi:hypothetical protein